MRKKPFIFIFFTFFVKNAFCQTLCTKYTVIKPLFQTETKKVLVSPAVFETKNVQILLKDGFWDIEYKAGLPCKTWREPEYTTSFEQFIAVEAVFKTVTVQKSLRNGEVYTFLGDCN